MDEDEFSEADLQRMSYRDLQQRAKARRLPSNVKKMYLIQMLIAKQYQSEDEVQRIVQVVKLERQQLASSSSKKKTKKKPSRVQGSEISSTYEVHAIEPKIAPAALPPAPAPAQSSDRVLRSYNMRSTRRKPNYCLMNDPNPILGDVKSDIQMSPRESTGSVKSHVNETDKYPKLKMTPRCVMKKIQTNIDRSYLNKDNNQVSENQRQTQSQGLSSSSYLTDLSSNQGLSSSHSYKRVNQTENQNRSYLKSNKDNRLSENQGFRNYLENQASQNEKTNTFEAENQANQPRNFILENQVASHQVASRSYKVNVLSEKQEQLRNYFKNQGSCNYYRGNGNQSETPAPSRSYVRENQLLENRIASSYVNNNSIRNNSEQGQGRSYLKRANQLVSVDRNMDVPPPKRQRTLCGIQQISPPAKSYECYQNDVISNTSISIRRTDGQYSKIKAVVQRPQKPPQTSTTKSSTKDKVRQSVMKMKTYDSRSIQQRNKKSIVQSKTINSYRSVQVTVQDIINSNIDRSQTFTNPIISEYVITETNKSKNVTKDTTDIRLRYPNLTAHIEGTLATDTGNVTNVNSSDSQNVTNLSSSDFSQISTVTVDSSLTERTESTPSVDTDINDPSDLFCDYYHKKIRAEKVRSNTNSQSFDAGALGAGQEGAGGQQVLPKINSVFSQLNSSRDKDLTKPLFVQVSEGNHTVPFYPISSSAMLEGLFNFKRSLLTHAPFDSLPRTVAETKCVYSTPMISSTLLNTTGPIAAVASAENQNVVFDHQAASFPGQAKMQVFQPSKYQQFSQDSLHNCLSQSQNQEKTRFYVAEGTTNTMYGTQYANENQNRYENVDTGLLKPVYDLQQNNDNIYQSRYLDDQRTQYNFDDYRPQYATDNQMEKIDNYISQPLNSNQINSTTDDGEYDIVVDNCNNNSPQYYKFCHNLTGVQCSQYTDSSKCGDQNASNFVASGSQYGVEQLCSTQYGEQNKSNYSLDQSVYSPEGNGSQYSYNQAGSQYSPEQGSQYSADDSQIVEPGSPHQVGSQYMDFDETSQSSQVASQSAQCDAALLGQDMLTNGNNPSVGVTIPEMVEDALEIISQDGDYMERIEMDVRMQCILCSWAGPKIILEHHIRKEHSDQIIKADKNEWNITYRLGSLVNQDLWLSQVIQYEDNLYALSVKYEDPEHFMANLSMISANAEPQTGSVTIYNKVSGEPFTWRGAIPKIHYNMPYETDCTCLTLQLSNLDLLPNRENVKLFNKTLVNQSPSTVVVGSPELNDIQIIMFVKVFY